MKPIYLVLSLSLLLTACTPKPAPAPKPPALPPEQIKPVSGPAEVKTPAGATLQVPGGMVATPRGNVVFLTDPENSMAVWLVELKQEKPDCVAAVKAAWASVDPKFNFKDDQQIKPPPGDKWDEVMVQTYVRQGDNHAQAVARRLGNGVWISLVRGTAPSLDKRQAQMRSFIASLKVPGAKEVRLDKRPFTPLGERKAELAALIEEGLKQTGAPGISLAVIEDGKLAWSAGFGVLELGKPGKVGPDTRMMIGSVTKSLTTLMMASLVDDKKLDWTAPVTKVYPQFKLGDAKLTEALTVEQLVCACAGLPRKDLPLIVEFSEKGPANVFKELALMSPSTGMKETFQYQNHMVAAGGYVAAAALGDSKGDLGAAYDKAMNERIFKPLGMTRTTLDLDAAIKDPDHAIPHSEDLKEQHHVVPMSIERFATYIRPSGGIWSTANDMARYVMAELARGKLPGGGQVASEGNLTRRWQPQVKISDKASYGLGWITAESRGLKVISHGGGTMGFGTLVSFLPNKNAGLVAISNGTGGHQVNALIWRRLLELWFGDRPRAVERLKFNLTRKKQSLARLKARMSVPDNKFMAPHLGTYKNPELGAFKIYKVKGSGGYELDAGEFKTTLMRHDRQDGKSVLIFASPPLAGLNLIPVEGKPGQLEMKRAQEKYLFKR